MAEEIAKTVVKRLPNMLTLSSKRKASKQKQRKIENGIFLDTSAIIDGRIFDVINLGVFTGTFVLPDNILGELKRIADASDSLKKERGRRALERLAQLKKNKKVKVVVLSNNGHMNHGKEKKQVDDELVDLSRNYKGKIITCDYNLEKSAAIRGVTAINMNALAQCLKVAAVPGELMAVKVLHTGKDTTQGVGYLDDGTMIVVEKGSTDVGKIVEVTISRVIQTASGKIFFAKKSTTPIS
jgi:uncharacterized protein YacL